MFLRFLNGTGDVAEAASAARVLEFAGAEATLDFRLDVLQNYCHARRLDIPMEVLLDSAQDGCQIVVEPVYPVFAPPLPLHKTTVQRHAKLWETRLCSIPSFSPIWPTLCGSVRNNSTMANRVGLASAPKNSR